MGGALRFLDELDAYLAAYPSGDIRLIGRGAAIGSTHMARRELVQPSADRRIALNNVSFVRGGQKVVLLRNALHFLAPHELLNLGSMVTRRLGIETKIVRALAGRADVIVVPSQSMFDRVLRQLPIIEARLVVRHHPLSRVVSAAPAGSVLDGQRYVLCPVLDAPFKRLGPLLRPIVAALEHNGLAADTRLAVTFSDPELSAMGLHGHPKIVGLGRLGPTEARILIEGAQALVYPTNIESFGYPLAEARLAAKPVIAHDTVLTREVAGRFLMPYAVEADLAGAVDSALRVELLPDVDNPFDPVSYFDWLFGDDKL